MSQAGSRARRASTALRLGIFVLLIIGLTSTRSFAASISIGPGSTPAGNYLGLSLFGITPIAGVGDDTITNFNVPSFLYAGQVWNRLGVVSNGYVVVGGGNGGDVSINNTDLPNPNAGIDAVTLTDWRQLIVYNPTTRGRSPLAVATSRDVKAWAKVLTLEDPMVAMRPPLGASGLT